MLRSRFSRALSQSAPLDCRRVHTDNRRCFLLHLRLRPRALTASSVGSGPSLDCEYDIRDGGRGRYTSLSTPLSKKPKLHYLSQRLLNGIELSRLAQRRASISAPTRQRPNHAPSSVFVTPAANGSCEYAERIEMQAPGGEAFRQQRETATEQPFLRSVAMSSPASAPTAAASNALRGSPVGGEASTQIIRKSHGRTQQHAFEGAGDVAGRMAE